MKDKKAVRLNKILAEVWKYEGEEMELWVWKCVIGFGKGKDVLRRRTKGL